MTIKKKDIKNELEKIAKSYCKAMGYTYLSSNTYKFSFIDDKDEGWTLTYSELEFLLKHKLTVSDLEEYCQVI